jgi:CHAT domain-containing protein/Tfp pilus assembly protein PilF
MTSFLRAVVLLAALSVTLSSNGGVLRTQQPTQRGVIVEEVIPNGSAATAGIRAGDVLLAWSRAASPPANPEAVKGAIDFPFDLTEVEVEQAPRGEVTLEGIRDGRNVSFRLVPGPWNIRGRPQMPAEVLPAYLKGKTFIDAKDTESAVGAWREAAAQAKQQNDPRMACWLLIRLGDGLREARQWSRAQASYEEAIAEAAAAGQVRVAALAWDSVGLTFEGQNNFAKAAEAYRESLKIRERAFPETLAVALNLSTLGAVLRSYGDLSGAESVYRRTLVMRERLAPGSLDLARTTQSLGVIAWDRGELDSAREYLSRGLLALEKLVPESVFVATTLNNLAILAADRGDLEAAEEYHRRALTIRARVAPGSLDLSGSLHNLGMVAHDRGDLAAAEDLYRKSLAIKEKVAPGSLPLGRTLNNLGDVARIRGDLPQAEDFFKQALAVFEKQSPGSTDVAIALNGIGQVALSRGDPEAAEDYAQRALAIRQKQQPESLRVATSLNVLGLIAFSRGNLAAAGDIHRKALALREKLAPQSLAVAETLHHSALVARNGGDLAAAEDMLRNALAIREKLAPGSFQVAASLYELGLIRRRTADSRTAADYFRRAVDAIETHIGRMGGAEEVRSSFAASYVDYYRDYIDLLLEQGKTADAFHVLERSRARNLLAMLAERDLVLLADVSAEVQRERKLIDAEYDRTQRRLVELNPGRDAELVERHLGRLRELRDKREGIRDQIRKTSPRLAALQYPEPLNVESIQRSLDPGTLLLSYMVTKEKTFLFAVSAKSGIRALRLPIGEAELREKIERFRNGIQRPAEPQDAWIRQSRELYRILVEPAKESIAASDRILISPDGPLHALPFAALVTDERTTRYWIETRPLHIVVSGTLYAELKKERPQVSAVSLVAFGDPKYPAFSAAEAETIKDPQTRTVVRRGYSLEPLPASRREVTAIAELYGKQAVVYLGDQATEERVKAVGKDIRYLHFATHGWLDERFPLNSSLALTIPESPADGQDNGLLQAWEIFEKVRINADLVVLSACETALGKEMGGEGLVGLTRAFQYAGARSIVASLWSVADESTSDLMKQMYGYLKAGRSKDEALRQAQIDLIRKAGDVKTRANLDTSHPFHWSAFQLIGDWK